MISMSEQQSLERDLLRFEPFLSRSYGMIESVNIRPIPAGGPRLFWVEANAQSLVNASYIKQAGSGIAPTLESAMCKALGETLERFSAMWHRQCGVLKSVDARSLREQGVSTVDVSLLPACPSENHKMDWVCGFYLDNRAPVWVPAIAAFYGYPGTVDSNSNGLACGRSENESLAGALFEVIERDAFAHTWWRQEQWDELEWRNSKASDICDLTSRLGSWGYNVRLFTLALPERILDENRVSRGSRIHSVFAIYKPKNPNNDSSFLISGAASTDLKEACVKALNELAVVHLNIQLQIKKIKTSAMDETFDRSINCFFDSVAYYANGKGDREIQFLLDPKSILQLDSHPSMCVQTKMYIDDHEARSNTKLASALSHCQILGARPIGIDLTTREIKGCGFHVHRVLVPELIPLNSVHKYRPIKHPRLQGPYDSGYPHGLSNAFPNGKEKTLNTFPHPFP